MATHRRPISRSWFAVGSFVTAVGGGVLLGVALGHAESGAEAGREVVFGMSALAAAVLLGVHATDTEAARGRRRASGLAPLMITDAVGAFFGAFAGFVATFDPGIAF